MLRADLAAGIAQAALAAVYFSGSSSVVLLGTVLPILSVAGTFQRLAYLSAIPQLVPKHYLGQANGVDQLVMGTTQFIAPLVGAALLAAVDLKGIIAIDMITFFVSVGGLLAVRFPTRMAHSRREALSSEIAHGLRYTWQHRGIRAMLLYFALWNVFIATLFLLIAPLVLGFGSTTTVAHVTVAGGIGAALGGLTLWIWGGPSGRPMRGMLVCALVLSPFALLVGLRPSALVAAIGVWGMYYWLSMTNGIYVTIIQTKVPTRLHGRVLALNLLVAWSTIPVAYAIVGPVMSRLFGSTLERDGALSATFGGLLGLGHNRGIGLVFVLFGLIMALLTLGAMALPVLRHFDRDEPDADADDLLGRDAALRKRRSFARQSPHTSPVLTVPSKEVA